MRTMAVMVGVAVTVSTAGVLAMATAATPPSPSEVIAARQQGFKKLGVALKLIHNEVGNSSPDAAKVAAAAADIKAATGAIESWFPAGSGPESGLKTHARPEIWTDASGFAATRAAYIRQAEKSVRQLSDPAERAAWKDSSSALGQACKDCHDSYRVKG